VEDPDESTFIAGIGGPESVLPGWLWRIPSDDNQQIHTHSSPDYYPTTDAHNGSGPVSSGFSPALSGD
jgi:hypothetical protein